MTAFDANTGEVTWAWSGDAPGYGSPVVIDVGGTRQIVTITKGKLVGVDAATETLLWEREFVSGNDTNTITPTVYGETLIVSGNGGPTTALTVTRQNDGWVAETTWENEDIPLRMSDAVLVGDTLFGLSTGTAVSTSRSTRGPAAQSGRLKAVRPDMPGLSEPAPWCSVLRMMASWSSSVTSTRPASRFDAIRSPTTRPGPSRSSPATACLSRMCRPWPCGR